MSTITPLTPGVEYPDSDGQPMAENTLQYEWIVTIKGNLDLLLRDRADVFVAGDNLIYPVEGNNLIRQAPDVYVAFGRPKGHRGSYKVWEEGGIFPQVVFEVLSPGNRSGEMARKFVFYENHGAEEYYVLDPDRLELRGYVCHADRLDDVPVMNGWVSPRLGIRFAVSKGDEVAISYPDGRPFLSFVEIGTLAQEATRRAEKEKERAEKEKERAEKEKERAERLARRLRELGVDPDAT